MAMEICLKRRTDKKLERAPMNNDVNMISLEFSANVKTFA